MEYTEERQAPDVIKSDTDNATQVRPSEAPFEKREKFRCFRAYNTNMWNGPKRENTEQFRRQDDLHRYDALASSLYLTDYQKQRGRGVMDDLNFQQLGKPIDHIIFAICTVVANNDVDDGYRYWPHRDALETDDQFEAVAESLGLSTREQLSVVQQVKSRTQF